MNLEVLRLCFLTRLFRKSVMCCLSCELEKYIAVIDILLLFFILYVKTFIILYMYKYTHTYTINIKET